METIGRYLMIGGIALFLVGGGIYLSAKFGLPLGRLPGDIRIEEKMAEYCLPSVAKKINALGGVDEGKKIPRKIDLKVPPGSYQPLLFNE